MAHRILIVEDDDLIRESLRDLLRDEGYEPITAENGQAALDWLRANPPPCLILLDIFMPVLSGIQFREHQLSDPELAPIPVVVVSAIEQARTAALKVAAHLCKPVDVDRLLAVTRQFCTNPP